MNKVKVPKPLDITYDVKGISDPIALDKFVYYLQQNYNSNSANRRQYILAHERINADGNTIDVSIYSSSKIRITAPPKMDPAKFGVIATEIKELACTSLITIKSARVLSLKRADSIVDYISKIDLDDEYLRMLAVILADTSNEIIITEFMKTLKIDGPPLEDNLPNKLNVYRTKNNMYTRKKKSCK